MSITVWSSWPDISIAQKERTIMRKILVALAALPLLAACEKDADVASRNLSQAADMFEINRRVVFYNGITSEYILTIEGLCSLGNQDKSGQLSVTCKTGPSAYKKHFLGLSDNVTYFAEQIEAASVSTYHYRVVFKPQSIVPDVDFRGDARELVK
jgi:hypothetical protein